VTPIEWTVALGAVFAGACAQGTLGFGLGLLAAPVLALIDVRFVPGPLLIVALVLTVLVARRERGMLDWKGVRWAVIGRVPGSIVGVAAVAVLPDSTLAMVFAALVLAGVLLSAGGWQIEPTGPTLFTAGAASGLMGTVTTIGGPPMALVYQRRTGAQLRSSLALFFVFGAALSTVLLAAAGEIVLRDVAWAAALVPPMLLGFSASRSLARVLDRGFIRPAVLGFSGAASVALLVSELV
jgi:uncharacterized protein